MYVSQKHSSLCFLNQNTSPIFVRSHRDHASKNILVTAAWRLLFVFFDAISSVFVCCETEGLICLFPSGAGNVYDGDLSTTESFKIQFSDPRECLCLFGPWMILTLSFIIRGKSFPGTSHHGPRPDLLYILFVFIVFNTSRRLYQRD